MGIGPSMVAGVALVALAILVVLPITAGARAIAREDLALALSVVLLGMLMMITRRNAILQVVGLMSLENGLILAAVGVAGMPLVVELSTAALVMMLLVVGGVFVFQIRERFDTLDIGFLDRASRGSRLMPLPLLGLVFLPWAGGAAAGWRCRANAPAALANIGVSAGSLRAGAVPVRPSRRRAGLDAGRRAEHAAGRCCPS